MYSKKENLIWKTFLSTLNKLPKLITKLFNVMNLDASCRCLMNIAILFNFELSWKWTTKHYLDQRWKWQTLLHLQNSVNNTFVTDKTHVW